MKLGVLTADPGALLVEAALAARLDFVLLDAESTALAPADCVATVHAFRGTGVKVLVRLPAPDPEAAITYANTGVDELVLPRVRAPEELVAVRDALRPGVNGRRPVQPSVANGYGRRPTSETRVSALVETREALAAMTRIAEAAPGTFLWLGEGDLRADLERAGEPEHAASIRRAFLFGAAEAGLPFGLVASDSDGIAAAARDGAARCVFYWERFVVDCLVGLLDPSSAA